MALSTHAQSMFAVGHCGGPAFGVSSGPPRLFGATGPKAVPSMPSPKDLHVGRFKNRHNPKSEVFEDRGRAHYVPLGDANPLNTPEPQTAWRRAVSPVTSPRRTACGPADRTPDLFSRHPGAWSPRRRSVSPSLAIPAKPVASDAPECGSACISGVEKGLSVQDLIHRFARCDSGTTHHGTSSLATRCQGDLPKDESSAAGPQPPAVPMHSSVASDVAAYSGGVRHMERNSVRVLINQFDDPDGCSRRLGRRPAEEWNQAPCFAQTLGAIQAFAADDVEAHVRTGTGKNPDYLGGSNSTSLLFQADAEQAAILPAIPEFNQPATIQRKRRQSPGAGLYANAAGQALDKQLNQRLSSWTACRSTGRMLGSAHSRRNDRPLAWLLEASVPISTPHMNRVLSSCSTAATSNAGTPEIRTEPGSDAWYREKLALAVAKIVDGDARLAPNSAVKAKGPCHAVRARSAER